MVQLFAPLVGLIFTFLFYINKVKYNSLKRTILALLLVNDMFVITRYPVGMPISRWLIYSLLLVSLLYFNKFKKNWRTFPLRYTLIFLILGSLSIGIFDPRLSIFQKFYSPFRDITETYFVVFLGYLMINDKHDFQKLYKPLSIAIIFIGLYGLYNYITLSNPYYKFMIESFFQGATADLDSKMRIFDANSDRRRAASTFNLTFNYGYASALIGLVILALKVHTQKKKQFYRLALFSAFVGAFICGSRTVLITTFFVIVVFIFFAMKPGKIFISILIAFIIGMGSYTSIKPLRDAVDRSVDIFQPGGGGTKGSSLEMRVVQFVGALRYFQKSPIRGNGYEYIIDELGWGDRDNKQLDSDLKGFESIIYKLMIEQGVIGLTTKFLFFISLIIYFLKNRRNSITKTYASFGLALTTLFLIFSIGTGALGAWPLTMLFLGVTIKTIELSKKSEVANLN